jgi:hypothetical protein
MVFASAASFHSPLVGFRADVPQSLVSSEKPAEKFVLSNIRKVNQQIPEMRIRNDGEEYWNKKKNMDRS